MESFIARLNIEHYRRLLDAERDPHQIELLQRVLAEEQAKLQAAETAPGLGSESLSESGAVPSAKPL